VRVLEKVKALIARFMKEIEDSRSFIELEQMEDVVEEGEVDEARLPQVHNLENASLKIEDFMDLMDGENTTSLELTDVIAKSEKLTTNNDPKKLAESPETSLNSIPKEKVFDSFVDRIFHTNVRDDVKPEDDISVEYEEENRELLIKSTTFTSRKKEDKDISVLDMGSITRIPLLLEDNEDDDEEITVQYRSLPKNVQKHNSKNFVMVPKYKKKKVGSSNFSLNIEHEIPDESQFMALGYDSKNRKSKHYRYVLGKELEHTVYMGARQFQSIPVFRGKQVLGKESFLQRLLSGFSDPTFKNVGTFKGVVDIISKQDLDELNELGLEKEGINLNIATKEDTWKNITPLELDLMKKSYVMVRVYVIDSEIYDSYDMGSQSDPYLRLTLGKNVIDEKNNFIEDRDNPRFMKMYELKTTFPGDSHLYIEVWDKDAIKSDELIGCTRIDIENRYYDNKWRDLEHIPIETRRLYHPSSKQEKGIIRMWVEIFETLDTKAPSIKKSQLPKSKTMLPEPPKSPLVWDITPRPVTELEIRVVVWETTDVPMADIEDTVDIYVTCSLPALPDIPEQKTDTHFRSQTGFVGSADTGVFQLENEVRPQDRRVRQEGPAADVSQDLGQRPHQVQRVLVRNHHRPLQARLRVDRVRSTQQGRLRSARCSAPKETTRAKRSS
jgi:hypothetical protein